MRITITGKNIQISDYLYSTVEKQVKKLEKYFDSETAANIMMSIQRNRHTVEVTIICGPEVIRAADVTGDMYASVNNALKKIERRIIKHRTRISHGLRSDAFHDESPVFGDTIEPEELKERNVVKVKHFDLKPMTVDEAILQLELLGHSFYVFTNGNTGDVNVLYLRNDGDYGLIEPEA